MNKRIEHIWLLDGISLSIQQTLQRLVRAW